MRSWVCSSSSVINGVDTSHSMALVRVYEPWRSINTGHTRSVTVTSTTQPTSIRPSATKPGTSCINPAFSNSTVPAPVPMMAIEPVIAMTFGVPPHGEISCASNQRLSPANAFVDT